MNIYTIKESNISVAESGCSIRNMLQWDTLRRLRTYTVIPRRLHTLEFTPNGHRSVVSKKIEAIDIGVAEMETPN